MARALRHVNPNTFTWISLAAAIFGGYAFFQSGPTALNWLAMGWFMVLLNSVLDLLDGKVAKMTDQQTLKGDYLDHAIDRFSDVAFLVGLSLSPWVPLELGVFAIVFTLLTSYLGTQAQAVGIGRNYGGLLGRADRMVMLLVVPWAQIAWTNSGRSDFEIAGYSLSLLGWMFAYLAVVGFITMIQRFAGGLSAFNKEGNLD